MIKENKKHETAYYKRVYAQAVLRQLNTSKIGYQTVTEMALSLSVFDGEKMQASVKYVICSRSRSG